MDVARNTPERSRLEAWLVVLVTAVGAALRLQGITSDLWVDEGYWAEALARGEMLGDPKRPPGFVLLSWLATRLSMSEAGLRAVPFLSSVAMIPLSWAVARRLFGGAAGGLLAAVVVATCSTFIDFAKEFKPYIFEAALHLVLLLAVLRYAATPTRRRLLWVCVLVVLAAPLGTSLLFALPGAVVVTWYAARASEETGHARAVVVASLASLAVILLLYLWSWSRPVGDAAYWGGRYGVFDVEGASHVAWLRERLARTLGIAFMAPHPQRVPWIGAALPTAYKVLFVGGLGLALVTRRWIHLVLCATPVVVTYLFNLAGRWPFGPFRTNQYLLLYTQLLALFPLGYLAVRARGPALRSFVLVLVAGLFVYRLPWNTSYYALKGHAGAPGEAARTGSVRQAMLAIHAHDRDRLSPEAPRIPIVCDPWTFARDYYLTLHPDFAPSYGPWFAEHYEWRCSLWDDPDIEPLVEAALASHESFWIVRTWEGRRELDELARLGLRTEHVVTFPIRGYTALVRRTAD